MEKRHDLFITTMGLRRGVDDIYSVNKMYEFMPFECIRQHLNYYNIMTSLLDKVQKSSLVLNI